MCVSIKNNNFNKKYRYTTDPFMMRYKSIINIKSVVSPWLKTMKNECKQIGLYKIHNDSFQHITVIGSQILLKIHEEITYIY